MLTCKICGCQFNATKDNHYISREPIGSGLVQALSSTECKMYDTFDCIQCGCQVIAQERRRVTFDIEVNDILEEE